MHLIDIINESIQDKGKSEQDSNSGHLTTYKFDEAIKILRYILLENALHIITLSQFDFLTSLAIALQQEITKF